jgi:hypothetical protein
LNTAIRQNLYNKKHALSPSSIAVYKLLAKYAVKFAGCAFLKIDKISELTGYARRTVFKALAQLEELEMVLRKNVMRSKSGGKGASLFIFQKYRKMEELTVDKPVKTNKGTSENARCEEVENPTVASDEVKENGSEAFIFSSKEISKINRRICSPYSRIKSIVYSFVKDDKQMLHRIYGIYTAQTRYLKDAYSEEVIITTALYALRETFAKVKTAKVRDIPGYFNGTFSNCFEKLYYANFLKDLY